MSDPSKNDKVDDTTVDKKDDAIKPDRTIEIVHKFEKGKGFDGAEPVKEPKKPETPVKTDNPVVDDPVPPKKDVPSLEALKQQLADEKKKREEFEGIVALQAEEDFKNEKNAVLAQVPEAKRAEIEKLIGDDPDVLEEIKRNIALKNAFTPAEPAKTDDVKTDTPPAQTPEEKFQAELEDFLGLVDDDSKKEEMRQIIGTDPDKLAQAKIWSTFIKQGIEQAGGTITGVPKRAPKGKSTIPPQVDPEAENYKTYIDELYSVKRDPSKTAAEKQEADRMLDELFMQVIKGLNVSRRKTGHSLPNYQVNQCPSCGALSQSPLGVEFENCPACGWSLYTKGARR